MIMPRKEQIIDFEDNELPIYCVHADEIAKQQGGHFVGREVYLTRYSKTGRYMVLKVKDKSNDTFEHVTFILCKGVLVASYSESDITMYILNMSDIDLFQAKLEGAHPTYLLDTTRDKDTDLPTIEDIRETIRS